MRTIEKTFQLPMFGEKRYLIERFGQQGIQEYAYIIGDVYFAVDKESATYVALKYGIPTIEHMESEKEHRVVSVNTNHRYAVYRRHYKSGEMVRVDTVFFSGCTAEGVHKNLIENDGYATDIIVVDEETGDKFPRRES